MKKIRQLIWISVTLTAILLSAMIVHGSNSHKKPLKEVIECAPAKQRSAKIDSPAFIPAPVLF